MFVPPTKLHRYCRSKRDTANKHTAQHRAICSAQAALGMINSLFAPNHGPLFPAPFTCTSVAGGVRRPRSGALVSNTSFYVTFLRAHIEQTRPHLIMSIFPGMYVAADLRKLPRENYGKSAFLVTCRCYGKTRVWKFTMRVFQSKTYYDGEYFHRLFLSLTGISDAKNKNHPLWDQKSSLFLGSEIIEARNQQIW